ncbi:hypothetical protein E4U37_001455 [Claviceps purpurea]|nr:hypothetical protein E4U37_001455 [Claviceps purpurea]
MDAQGENIPSRERPSNVMKNVYDTFAECLGVASPDDVWATFYPVLREGYEHAREMGRRVERKRQSLPTGEQSTMEDANGAIKALAAVAARHLRSGDTVVTFKEPARPHVEADGWVKAAFGPEATRSRRLFSFIIKSFPVRLSGKQDATGIAKRMSASNGPGIAKVTTRKPRASAKFAPIVIAVDGIEAANKLCRDGIN